MKSRTESKLNGKKTEFVPGRVASIEVSKNGTRVVTDVYGNKRVTTKQKLLGAFNKALSADQRAAMSKTIKLTKQGTATMQLGGHVKGKQKEYVSVKAAEAALDRRYGKPEERRRTDPRATDSFGTRRNQRRSKGNS